MKLIEALFIEQNNDLFGILSEVLPVVPLSDSKLPAFRLEIDPELVLLLYRIDSENSLSPEILDNIFPHLERIVLLVSLEDVDRFNIPELVERKINEYPVSVPAMVAMALNEKSVPSLKKQILEKGLYLGEKNRLFFWNPAQHGESLRIWKNIWMRIE
jgi:hypothetical protein